MQNLEITEEKKLEIIEESIAFVKNFSGNIKMTREEYEDSLQVENNIPPDFDDSNDYEWQDGESEYYEEIERKELIHDLLIELNNDLFALNALPISKELFIKHIEATYFEIEKKILEEIIAKSPKTGTLIKFKLYEFIKIGFTKPINKNEEIIIKHLKHLNGKNKHKGNKQIMNEDDYNNLIEDLTLFCNNTGSFLIPKNKIKDNILISKESLIYSFRLIYDDIYGYGNGLKEATPIITFLINYFKMFENHKSMYTQFAKKGTTSFPYGIK